MKLSWISLKLLRFLAIAALTTSTIVGLIPQFVVSQTETLEIPVQTVPASTMRPSYGHFPYREDDPSRLKTVGQFVRSRSSRSESMDVEAVQAFQQMAIAARKSGVSLMPISGFRSVSVQTGLWKQQIARRGSKQAAAKWSAPPGYSEHHTGYAIDIADRQRPDTDLQISFANTRAYQWLAATADQYGFELSFPRNNKQGVSFEPWHWRYVGSARAEQIFSVAHKSGY
ncbi:M15 family metallopeptidase [Leptolyngbya sp. GGD]|uniref:M15 family metallopeptidase n=1 Tax=Leptolyngbya sp. GGD TaxID=2997907 RepID=UPI00227AB2D7|nr:M15 family metallopeptidase [Leptolyngbya sp. GGD]MCY6492905.1 D-alanyl-D-alanine carboxypeptidase family protein [Leptolyngbya sp. GGD]